MDKCLYEGYLQILREELLPAMGCTEPISLAYASALSRHILGSTPKKVEICVSGNILKNVKSVVVPNTGGLKGVSCAVSAGIVAGDHEKKLEVLSGVTPRDIAEIKRYLQTADITVTQSRSGCVFDITVKCTDGMNSSTVRIAGSHTNVVHIDRNGEDILNVAMDSDEPVACADRTILTVEKIIEFANCVKIADVDEIISRQIDYNTAIAREGLKNDYGARIGKVLMGAFGESVQNRAMAFASAGSDARMNGCSLPVVIVSGSGNQGMTASLPLVIYAEHLGLDREKLIRGLVVSNLVTIRLKTGIGRLSAYCGAVSAGCGAGSGICYLHGGAYEQISRTIVNALAINSGVICDGAKSSCAAKIASAVEAGILGFEMAKKGCNFCDGDGILGDCVEHTIDNVGDIARIGMRGTDEEIIKLMIKKC